MFWKLGRTGWEETIHFSKVCQSVQMISEMFILRITISFQNHIKTISTFLGKRAHASIYKIMHAIFNCTPQDTQIFNKAYKSLNDLVLLHHIRLIHYWVPLLPKWNLWPFQGSPGFPLPHWLFPSSFHTTQHTSTTYLSGGHFTSNPSFQIRSRHHKTLKNEDYINWDTEIKTRRKQRQSRELRKYKHFISYWYKTRIGGHQKEQSRE